MYRSRKSGPGALLLRHALPSFSGINMIIRNCCLTKIFWFSDGLHLGRSGSTWQSEEVQGQAQEK